MINSSSWMINFLKLSISSYVKLMKIVQSALKLFKLIHLLNRWLLIKYKLRPNLLLEAHNLELDCDVKSYNFFVESPRIKNHNQHFTIIKISIMKTSLLENSQAISIQTKNSLIILLCPKNRVCLRKRNYTQNCPLVKMLRLPVYARKSHFRRARNSIDRSGRVGRMFIVHDYLIILIY